MHSFTDDKITIYISNIYTKMNYSEWPSLLPVGRKQLSLTLTLTLVGRLFTFKNIFDLKYDKIIIIIFFL